MEWEGESTDPFPFCDGPREIAGSFNFEPKVLIIADTIAIIANDKAPFE